MDKNKIKTGLKWFYFSFIWLMVLVFALDLISKWIVQNNLDVNQVIALIPNFLNITLIHNVGAAFSLGATGDIGWRIFFIAISTIIGFGLLAYYIVKYKKITTWQKVIYSLIIAGALGNLVDRAFYWKGTVGFDGVIDWIDFQFGNYHFATFNLADASLVVGVLALIVLYIIEAIKESKQKAKNGEYSLSPDELKKKQEEDKAKELPHDEEK